MYSSSLLHSAMLAPSLNHPTMVSAVTSPMLSRASRLSRSAAARREMSPKVFARSAAATLPTPSMPRAYIKRSKVTFLLFFMAFIKFSAFLSLKPSSSSSFSLVSRYSSDAFLSPNLSCSSPAVISESPSMSIAPLDAKCSSFATILGRQSVLGQKIFAPLSTSGVPQKGHTVGLGISALPSTCSTVPKISGMTSLERRISTLLPFFTSLRSMSP